MIPKHILFAGLSLLTGASLVLNSASAYRQISLPADPQPTSRLSLSNQIAFAGASTRSQAIQVPASPKTPKSTSATMPSPISTGTTKPKSTSPARPVRANSPDFTYSALPFTTGTVSTTGGSSPWWLTTVKDPAMPSSGAGTLVAVIDTGFALTHTGLSDRWWTNPTEMGPTASEGPAPNCSSRGLALDKSCNNLDNDGDGYPSDWRGWDFANNDNSPQAGTTDPAGGAVEHGTFVSGLIAGSLTSTSGGIDANAHIMPLEALSDSGNGTTTTVADAILYASDHGAQIISLSLGSSSDDQYLHQAIDYAISQGAIVVAAAGNSGCNCMLYPANYPEVIGVGASTSSDTLASFSSYGSNLDLVAPGQDLCSTTWLSSNETSAYACGGAGTSFATPIVAGALSRLIAAGVTTKLADQYLDITADKLVGMGGSWRTLQYGTGRLDVTLALSALSGPHVIASSASLIRNSCDGTADCSVTLIDTAGTTTTLSSKQPTGQAAAVYWTTPTSDPNGSVWLVNDVNTSTLSYYSFTNK